MVNENRKAIEMEKDAFLRMKPELLKHYKDRWVAVLDGSVIDSDMDGSSLAKRVYGFHGKKAIYIDEVTEVEKVVHIRTPFRIR